jgi:hypothetical protein
VKLESKLYRDFEDPENASTRAHRLVYQTFQRKFHLEIGHELRMKMWGFRFKVKRMQVAMRRRIAQNRQFELNFIEKWDGLIFKICRKAQKTKDEKM